MYFSGDFSVEDRKRDTFKIYLIYMFSIVGFLFTFSMGVLGLGTNEPITLLTFLLLFISSIMLLNIVYLKITDNVNVGSSIVLYLFFILMIYLVYSGGVSNTGPLWIYCFPSIALFLHGFKKGVLDILIFVIILSIILFYPNDALLATSYTDEFQLRIILSLILVIILSSVYEYSRTQSFSQMEILREELEFSSTRDQLTGLYNRRGYDSNINQRADKCGGILMCDIDHFKKINDTHGHDAGDYSIQEVANCIERNLRDEDIAVRWGGEEFFIFLPKASIHDAYLVGEKLRETIEDLSIKISDEKVIQLTLSIGVSRTDEEIPLSDAIRHADDAMYHSKSNGRNQTSKHE